MGTSFAIKGKIVLPFQGVREGLITIQDGKITSVDHDMGGARGSEVLELPESFISPGFIDVHVHGGGGFDFSDGTPEAFDSIAKFHAQGGTTALLATVVPLEREQLLHTLDQLQTYINGQGQGVIKGSRMVGIHLEGPFVNPMKKGALDERHLLKPDLEFFQAMSCAAGGCLKAITLAPELEGAGEIIKEAYSRGIVVSAGHTIADYPVLKAAAGLGLAQLTHFYNAMAGLHHRSAGTVAGGLLLDELSVEIIPDINHLDPVAVQLACRVKGLDKVCAITDCMRAGGMPNGSYRLGELTVELKDGVARLADSTLAGSTITMIQAVRYLVDEVGLAIADAVGLATVNPARMAGLSAKGDLAPGKDADITIFDSDFRVQRTFIAGRQAFAI